MNLAGGNLAYLDCFSGLAGDMLLAALLDAGLPMEYLRRQLAALPLQGYELEVQRTDRGGISAVNFQVKLTGDQPQRCWRKIRELLTAAALAPEVKEKALLIFQSLAEAEARVHGVAVAEVHFHEVGAVDSLVDIVGAAAGLCYFKIDRLLCAPLPLTRGWVNSDHGPLPLPAPATLELLRDLPTYGLDLEMELVTPTGAALAKALVAEYGPPPPMTIRRLGYGAGSKPRPDGKPNLLRLLIGEAGQPAEAQSIEVIETQLDDWSPEGFPHLCRRLLDLGALDVSLTPLLMKKGRPGHLLRVLSDPARAHALKECLLAETTAIGLRFHRQQRLTLPREPGTVNTPWGEIAVKKVATPRGVVLYPEYESCRQAALRHQVPLLQIHTLVAALPPEQFRPSFDLPGPPEQSEQEE